MDSYNNIKKSGITKNNSGLAEEGVRGFLSGIYAVFIFVIVLKYVPIKQR